jgi:hypothetical protein
MYAPAGDTASLICAPCHANRPSNDPEHGSAGSDRSGWARRADEETAPNGRSVALDRVVVKPYPLKVFG